MYLDFPWVGNESIANWYPLVNVHNLRTGKSPSLRTGNQVSFSAIFNSKLLV